jgi:hypothetical protein
MVIDVLMMCFDQFFDFGCFDVFWSKRQSWYLGSKESKWRHMSWWSNMATHSLEMEDLVGKSTRNMGKLITGSNHFPWTVDYNRTTGTRSLNCREASLTTFYIFCGGKIASVTDGFINQHTWPRGITLYHYLLTSRLTSIWITDSSRIPTWCSSRGRGVLKSWGSPSHQGFQY